ALESRIVMGGIRNDRDAPVMGATVELIIGKDTLKTSSDQFGTFRFEKVKSAEFILRVRAMGYEEVVRKIFENDTKSFLYLRSIVVGETTEKIDEIVVSRTPGSVVRGDTTEYWASDYIVRDFARLKDLLERMEGVTIDEKGDV